MVVFFNLKANSSMTVSRSALDAHVGLSYETYKQQWRQKCDAPMSGLDKTARKYRHYTRYNWDREEGVWARYTISPFFRAAVDSIQEDQLWVVLTEDWCVDSAYSLPVMVMAARQNPRITLRILLRDENLDVMDAYLTNGGRAIPKLIVFSNGQERFLWGAKPRALAELRTDLKANGALGSDIVQATIDWYENQGWREVERELTQAIQETMLST